MKTYPLKGVIRTTVGRKVKHVRVHGEIPATIYGRKIKSISVSVAAPDFFRVYEKAGETGVVELSIAGAIHPVLIHNVQRDPVQDAVLHVEFYQVDLKEKVHTNVPISLVGQAPVVAERRGVLLTLLSEVEVEALPADLPDRIDVDVSKLTELDQEITIAHLIIPSGVSVLDDHDVAVVKVSALVSKEAEQQAAAEAAAAAAAATAETEQVSEAPQEEVISEAPPEEKATS